MADTMIEADGLVKSYGETRALAGVSFSVPAGSVLGSRPERSREDHSCADLDQAGAAGRGPGPLAGIDVLARPAAVRRQIGVAAQPLLGRTADRQAEPRAGRRAERLRTGQARTRAAELLELFDLADAADRVVKGYSGGMRRLARGHHRPVPGAADVAARGARRPVLGGLADGLPVRARRRRHGAGGRWRTSAGPLPIIAGFALLLLYAYSLSWVAACVGLNSKSPESAASFGFIVLFPLAFVSNAMVPTQHMPGWLQAIADWNPVSAVTAAARQLWDNPNPSASIGAWPMQHPIEASLPWSALILAVAARSPPGISGAGQPNSNDLSQPQPPMRATCSVYRRHRPLAG